MTDWKLFRKQILEKTEAIKRSQSGVAAVEFAMLAPVLLFVYLGSVDLSQGVDADRKLAYVTHTIGDLAAQTSGDITSDELEGLLALAETAMRPFDPARVSLRITVADIASNGSYTLYEPVTRQAGSGRCSGDITLPQEMIDLARGQTIVATEGCYSYTPVVGYAIDADIPLYKRSFHVPRSDKFNYLGETAAPTEENEDGTGGGGNGGENGNGGGGGNGGGNNNCAGNSGGKGKGNNCNNNNNSHGGNGGGGNGKGNRG